MTSSQVETVAVALRDIMRDEDFEQGVIDVRSGRGYPADFDAGARSVGTVPSDSGYTSAAANGPSPRVRTSTCSMGAASRRPRRWRSTNAPGFFERSSASATAVTRAISPCSCPASPNSDSCTIVVTPGIHLLPASVASAPCSKMLAATGKRLRKPRRHRCVAAVSFGSGDVCSAAPEARPPHTVDRSSEARGRSGQSQNC